MANEILLVAGTNYPEYKPVSKTKWRLHPYNAGPWRIFSTRWAERAHKVDRTTIIRLIDFFNGTFEEASFDKKGQVKFNLITDWGKLNPNNFRRYNSANKGDQSLFVLEKEVTLPKGEGPSIAYFTGIDEVGTTTVSLRDYISHFFGAPPNPLNELTISMTDVYDYIANEIGATRSHSLSELHIFSHGYAGGPILCNSLAIRNAPPERSLLDKDGRNYDFSTKNMDLANFKKAFSLNGRCYIWGCNAYIFMKKLILEIIKQKKRISDPTQKKYQFQWTSDWISDQVFFHKLLGGTTGKSDKLSLNELIVIIRNEMAKTYMQNLALASGCKVLGGLPGTYSDLDHTGVKANQLLHIPMGDKFGDEQNFSSVLDFYKNSLAVEFDPSLGFSSTYGRGYGIFKP